MIEVSYCTKCYKDNITCLALRCALRLKLVLVIPILMYKPTRGLFCCDFIDISKYVIFPFSAFFFLEVL